MADRQMVRITSLAKFLKTIEITSDELLGTKHLYKTEAETNAFKDGMKAALNILRKEYGVVEDREEKGK